MSNIVHFVDYCAAIKLKLNSGHVKYRPLCGLLRCYKIKIKFWACQISSTLWIIESNKFGRKQNFVIPNNNNYINYFNGRYELTTLADFTDASFLLTITRDVTFFFFVTPSLDRFRGGTKLVLHSSSLPVASWCSISLPLNPLSGSLQSRDELEATSDSLPPSLSQPSLKSWLLSNEMPRLSSWLLVVIGSSPAGGLIGRNEFSRDELTIREANNNKKRNS